MEIRKEIISYVKYLFTAAFFLFFVGSQANTYDIKIGDKLLITGPSTGVQELELTSMMVNDVPAERAKKGDSCTIKTDFRVRLSDKLYKIVKNN